MEAMVMTIAFFLVFLGIALCVMTVVLSNRIVQLQRIVKNVVDTVAYQEKMINILFSGSAGVNRRISNTQLDVGNLEEAMEWAQSLLNGLCKMHGLGEATFFEPLRESDYDYPEILRGRLVDPQDQCNPECGCTGGCEGADLEDTECCEEHCRNCGG